MGAGQLRTFDKQSLTERFVAEGCALADFDHDGHVDLTAGNSIWYGPEFTRPAGRAGVCVRESEG